MGIFRKEYGKKNDTGKGKVRFAKNHGKGLITLLGISIFLLILLLLYMVLVRGYTVKNVLVEGNGNYTDQEIKDMVMEGRLGTNSLFLALKYRNKGVENVPFVETMDVTVVSPDTIRITVYEKAIAGYVEYLGRYMYFDKDGIVVETSEEITPGVPQVMGLTFSHMVLHEPLPVQNSGIFAKILNITQLMTKYGINADKIYFDKSEHITLYFDSVRAELGDDSNIDEKVAKIQSLLTFLEGKSGVIRMENYSEDSNMITFILDEQPE